MGNAIFNCEGRAGGEGERGGICLSRGRQSCRRAQGVESRDQSTHPSPASDLNSGFSRARFMEFSVMLRHFHIQ